VSSSLVLLTGSSKNADQSASWPDRLPSNATIVVYMPGHNLRALQERLLKSGVLPETPCAFISGATTGSERVHVTTVARLFDSLRYGGPRLVVVGEVVRLADRERLNQQFSHSSLSYEHTEMNFGPPENAE